MPAATTHIRKIARIYSTLLIVAAVATLLLLSAPLLALELQYTVNHRLPLPQNTQRIEQQSQISSIANSGLLQPDELRAVPAENEQFQVIIPKIGVDSPVIANVDASDTTQYTEALKQGLAHARGTNFPGSDQNTFIFGHSTDGEWNIARYNALFYNLRHLEEGDQIFVWFWGKKHEYRVTSKTIHEPDDVSFLTDAQDDTDHKLILQTCWPPGSVDKRLIVTATPVL